MEMDLRKDSRIGDGKDIEEETPPPDEKVEVLLCEPDCLPYIKEEENAEHQADLPDQANVFPIKQEIYPNYQTDDPPEEEDINGVTFEGMTMVTDTEVYSSHKLSAPKEFGRPQRKRAAKKEKPMVFCEHCKFATPNRGLMDLHIAKKHPTKALKLKRLTSGTYECCYRTCGFTGQTQKLLKNHLTKKHGETLTTKKCAHCEYTTVLFLSLKQHVDIHLFPGTGKNFKCPHNECDFTGSERRLLKNHLLKKHGENLNADKCPHCDFLTVIPFDLKKHMQTHLPSDKKQFKCEHPGCGYSSIIRQYLVNHLNKKHGEPAKLRQCPHCDFSTVLSTPYKLHLDTHSASDAKFNKCPYEGCSYSSTLKDSLKNHLIRKHGENSDPRNCPHCDFSTVSVTSLKRHLVTHADADKKPSKCSYEGCNASFGQSSGLLNHLVKHHGETHHLKLCPHCEYSSVYMCDIKKHIGRLHSSSDKQPFKCSHEGCTYACGDQNGLTNHLVKKHAEKLSLLNCPHCEFSTAYLSCLKRHISAKHKFVD